jgi:ligand-binding sensor domain-containing protein
VGQSIVGEWSSYTSTLAVNNVVCSGRYIYGASCGGLLEFDPETQEFQTYTSNDGLTSNDIKCLGLDKFGNLWLGMSSPKGEINIWNIEQQKVEQIFNAFTFGNELTEIAAIAFSQNASFAAYRFNVDWGIAYFKIVGDQYQYREMFQSFPVTVFEIYALSVINDTLWAATDGGLIYADLHQTDLMSRSAWKIVAGGIAGTMSNVIQYHDTLTVACGSSLYQIINSQAVLLDSTFTQNISILFTNPTGILYCISSGAVYRHKNPGWSRALSAYVTSCDFDENGILWGGSSTKCLWSYASGKAEFYLPNTMIENIYTSLYVDTDGTLIAGTPAGISVKTAQGWYNIKRSNDKILVHSPTEPDWSQFVADTIAFSRPERIYAIVRRSDGHYFFALYGSHQTTPKPGALLDFDFNDLTNYDVYDTTDQQIAGSEGKGGTATYLKVAALEIDRHDNLWITTSNAQNDNTLSVLTKDNQWVHFYMSDSDNYLNYHPTAVVIDANDRVWVSSEVFSGDTPAPAAGGIAVLDYNGTLADKSDDQWYWVTTTNGLADNAVFALAFDRAGELWIMTADGIQRAVVADNFPNLVFSQIDPAVLTSVAFAKECRIRVDDLNNKWITTVGMGVKVYSYNGIWLNDVEGFTTRNSSLLSNTVLDVAFNNREGLVYIATSKGISIYKSPYAVYGKQYRSLKIFPSPYRIPDQQPMIIDGLLQDSEVKIMTLDGTFIRHLTSIKGEVIGQQAFWDGKDHRGRYVSSGVYLCLAYTKEGDTTVGKIAIIRK